MRQIAIVFTNDEGRYYVEEVYANAEKAVQEWDIEKKIDDTSATRWLAVCDELADPTVKSNAQFLLLCGMEE